MSKSIHFFERLYLFILLIIIIIIALTPYLIRGGFSIFAEKALEVIAIVILFIIGYLVMLLYQREVAKNTQFIENLLHEKNHLQSQVEETFKYVGALNVQIKEMSSILSEIKKYPESHQDFKYIIQFLTEKVLGIVSTEWALLRLINLTNNQTLSEYGIERGDKELKENVCSNDELAKPNKRNDILIFASNQNNLNIRAFGVIPRQDITEEQKVFIKGIVNQLEMFYLIFSSLSGNNK